MRKNHGKKSKVTIEARTNARQELSQCLENLCQHNASIEKELKKYQVLFNSQIETILKRIDELEEKLIQENDDSIK